MGKILITPLGVALLFAVAGCKQSSSDSMDSMKMGDKSMSPPATMPATMPSDMK
jgi:hypothetical protein